MLREIEKETEIVGFLLTDWQDNVAFVKQDVSFAQNEPSAKQRLVPSDVMPGLTSLWRVGMSTGGYSIVISGYLVEYSEVLQEATRGHCRKRHAV